MSFISNLQRKRANYNCVEQARTQAKSLNLLSSGIYTEEERFIYELLQNAIDSFQDTAEAKLKVSIEVQGNYLVFSHNGKPFSENDVIGLCDVGNGSKEGDAKKIGYKGIGFKSVFMASTQVFVSSGSYTFKFDKEDSVSYMPKHLKPIRNDEVPWQIIPIETKLPPVEHDRDDINVVICLKLGSSKSIVSRIRGLLSQVDFLLFLNVPHIEIVFVCDSQSQLAVEKQTRGELIELSLDGNVESQWLLHTTSVPIGKDVSEYIKQTPTSIPDKLKGQKRTEVSFAIRVENDKIVGLTDTVVYTYLPTSYSHLDTPFLINANFITDASRQQLQSDSVWNQNLFRHIPKLYLQWIGKLAQRYSDSYFNALPRLKSYHSGLVRVFYSSLEDALEEVAFLPSLDDPRHVLKVSDAFVDTLDLADVVGIKPLVAHLNRSYNKKLRHCSRVSTSSLAIAQDYGVFILSWSALEIFFADDILLSKIDPQINYNLLSRFCEKYNESDISVHAQIIDSLKELACLMNSDGVLREIGYCSLPTDEDTLSIPVGEVDIIHPDVYTLLMDDSQTLDWLKEEFELSELSKMRFVDFILNRTYKINEANAIEIGQLLFRINKEHGFLNNTEYATQIQKLTFLTKQGVLKPITTLYLGTRYNPIQDVESVAPQEDIYISEAYVEDWGDELDVREWALFLKKCGANDSVGLSLRILNASNRAEQPQGEFAEYEMLNEAKLRFQSIKHRWSNHFGYKNELTRINVRFQYFTLVDAQNANVAIDRFVFNDLLSKPMPQDLSETIYGEVSYWSDVRRHPDSYIEHDLYDYIPNEYRKYKSFFEYLVSKVQRYPTTQGGSLVSEKVYLNTENIRALARHYLPVLDIVNPVHESWLDILLFKKELSLDDLLELLACISQETDKERIRGNKEQIEAIYRKILEQDLHVSGCDKIAEWGKTHRILCSKDGKFYKPSELSYVTVEGFAPERAVYVGKLEDDKPEGLVQFLTVLGVRVVTKITPQFENKSTDTALKKLLMSKLPYLSLIKASSGRKEEFEKCSLILESIISTVAYYHCSSINLSYGDEADVVSKRAYCEGMNLYYTGKINIPCLEALVPVLLEMLELRSKRAMEVLVVLSVNDHEEIRDYFSKKGYDTRHLSPMPMGQVDDSKVVIGSMGPSSNSDLSQSEKEAAQREAQKALMEEFPEWTFPEGYGTGSHRSVA
ncbi:MAG: hypothetical protein SPK09_06540, partial [Porphyromonas sp.]|nr:hypothetical protein [Porphyromonas sp.]